MGVILVPGPQPVTVSFHDRPNYWNLTHRGNLIKSTGPGTVACETHDMMGNAVEAYANGAGQVATFVADTKYSAPRAITASGLTTTLESNEWLALKSHREPSGEREQWEYNPVGQLSRIVGYADTATNVTYNLAEKSSTKTVNGRWVMTYLDGFGRTNKVETGDASGTKSIVETEYEACACSPLGKVKRVSRPYAPNGAKVWTTYTYDTIGRTTQVLAADGVSRTRYAYSGNTVTVTGAANKWKRMTMDAYGNIVQVNEPNPKESGEYVTEYEYDALHHLTKVKMPRPHGGGTFTQTRTWVYDAVTQRLSSMTLPETGTQSFTYYDSGLLKTKTGRQGHPERAYV